MKYGIALGGGGVRGAYQIGVWKALREMNIKLRAAVGTSIGAINAALMAQDEYETAFKMWRDISLGDIVELPENMRDEKNIFTVKNLASLLMDIQKNAGISMKPLENILRGIIDEDKLRASKVDFGLATFSLTDKKGVYKFKNDLPDGMVVDYIMASAGLLQAKKIKDKRFSDGGIFDNIPVTMLLDRGIKNIITIDVQGIGINRPFTGAGTNIIEIRSKNPQMGIMDFDKNGIGRSIDEGYFDCLKAFDRLSGDIYFIDNRSYGAARRSLSPSLISGLEKAARILGIERLNKYSFTALKDRVTEEYTRQSLKGVSADNISLDSLKKIGESTILVWLVNAIENKTLPSADKLSALGTLYDAASAILYFKK